MLNIPNHWPIWFPFFIAFLIFCLKVSIEALPSCVWHCHDEDMSLQVLRQMEAFCILLPLLIFSFTYVEVLIICFNNSVRYYTWMRCKVLGCDIQKLIFWWLICCVIQVDISVCFDFFFNLQFSSSCTYCTVTSLIHNLWSIQYMDHVCAEVIIAS